MSLALYILQYGAAVLAVVLVTAYVYVTRNFGFWKKKGVRQLKPLPFVGNMRDVALARNNIGGVLRAVYDEHKKQPFVGLFSFDEPVLQVHDLQIVKDVLVKEGQNFCDRNTTFSEKTDPIGAKNLFGLKGDKWKSARNALTPSFTSGKIKRMYELVIECGKLLSESLKKDAQSGAVVPVYEVAARYTTDCIAACAFGIQGNSLRDPDAEFRGKLRLAFEFSVFRSVATALSLLSSRIPQLLGVKLLRPEVEAFVSETISTTVEHREREGVRRGDFLDSLIELKKEGSSPLAKIKYILEEEDMIAHSTAFLLAGFETSATTISYALYEMAMNPQVQQRLRAEIQGALDGQQALTYELLHELKYLDMVMRETLRKYPPLPFLDRTNAVQPYTLPGTRVTLPKGSRVVIPLHAFHMDPDFFPDPKRFDPERFSDANKGNVVPYSYMPFGEGPRNCVGKRFALMQTKAGLVDVLREYAVRPCADTPAELRFNPTTFLLQPLRNIPLLFDKL